MAAKFCNLIFDLDNTLINSDVIYELALKEIGFSNNHPEYQKARSAVKANLPEGHTSARNRLLYFKKLNENANRFSATEVLKLMNRYENCVSRLVQEQVRTLQRVSLFETLVARGFHLVILTNENLRTQLLKLEAIDPGGKFFEALLTSEEQGLEKPHSEIFQRLLKEQKFAVSETLMIGDDVEADIVGAKAVGLTTVWTQEFAPKNSRPEMAELAKADYTIQKLDEILGIV